ncbi:MAG: YgiQ family radical SAM protein, partial [Planctomycetes bacterium]|nr:YgiQ family radical SAM protein [Planctomycetota bacterium]
MNATSTSSTPGAKRLSLPLWTETYAAPPLPMTPAEVAQRGWDAVDVVFVTGDAYVDHPSFAMAILGRVLEVAGFRVAILSQPDWHSCAPWRQFGRPRLFFGISAGNMDSLINHYTANRKVRNDDAYSPGGRIGLRPDRATLPYCHRAREAFAGVPIIAGGVEASLRRLAHYDYWSDTVRRSILLDAKADLLVYGMGEKVIVEIAQRLAAGQSVRDLRDLRSVAYVLGAREAGAFQEEHRQGQGGILRFPLAPASGARGRGEGANDFPGKEQPPLPQPETLTPILLPSFAEVKADKLAFVEATRLIHTHTNPFNAQPLVQFHDREAVMVNPPAVPLSQAEM